MINFLSYLASIICVLVVIVLSIRKYLRSKSPSKEDFNLLGIDYRAIELHAESTHDLKVRLKEEAMLKYFEKRLLFIHGIRKILEDFRSKELEGCDLLKLKINASKIIRDAGELIRKNRIDKEVYDNLLHTLMKDLRELIVAADRRSEVQEVRLGILLPLSIVFKEFHRVEKAYTKFNGNKDLVVYR